MSNNLQYHFKVKTQEVEEVKCQVTGQWSKRYGIQLCMCQTMCRSYIWTRAH